MVNYTVETLYREFLTAIRKDYIGTVTPEQFNQVMRDGMNSLSKVIDSELSIDNIYKNSLVSLQSYINDVPNGIDYLTINDQHTLSNHGGSYMGNGKYLLNNPLRENPIDSNAQTGELCVNSVKLPVVRVVNGTPTNGYLIAQSGIRLQSIDVAYDGSNKFVKCLPLSPDRLDVLNNSFTKPNERKCYHIVDNDLLIIYVPETVKSVKVKVSYVKRPFIPFFDRENPIDAAYPYVKIQDGLNYIYPYSNGYGSINPKIPYSLVPTLISFAVRSYLTYIAQVKI